MGFGWSFYGFFVVAVLWLLAYSLWVAATDARERGRDR
jgi:hypothetical protein